MAQSLLVAHTIDTNQETVFCLRLTERELHDSSFLDERVLGRHDRGRIALRFDNFIRLSRTWPCPNAGLRLVLHSGYSGSTSLMRSLDSAKKLTIYREPLALVTAAEMLKCERQHELLYALFRNYSQVYRSGQIPILKPSSRLLVVHRVVASWAHSLFVMSATSSEFVQSGTRTAVRRFQLTHNLAALHALFSDQEELAMAERLTSEEQAELLFRKRHFLLSEVATLNRKRVHLGRELVRVPQHAIDEINRELALSLAPEEKEQVISAKWWQCDAKGSWRGR